MKVVVVGAHGLLGAAIVSEWSQVGHTVTGLTRADLDVSRHAQVMSVIPSLAPDVVVNCTAYNRVDDAEDRPSDALAVNTWAVRSLVQAADRSHATFVHFSTVFVFDGRTDRPSTEDDAPDPQSAYGASKLMGEWFAATCPRHYVLRVESLFGGSAARSSVDTMLANMRTGRPVNAFADRTVSPSFVADVSWATRRLIETSSPAGLYHCVNSGHGSWLEVANFLRERSGYASAEIQGVPVASVTLKASRPKFAALSNAKLAALGIVMPTWQDAVSRHLV